MTVYCEDGPARGLMFTVPDADAPATVRVVVPDAGEFVYTETSRDGSWVTARVT